MMPIIDTLFARVLSPLEGYKTKLGAWIFAFLAVNQMFPLVGSGIGALLHYAAYALVAYGLRDAIDRK